MLWQCVDPLFSGLNMFLISIFCFIFNKYSLHFKSCAKKTHNLFCYWIWVCVVNFIYEMIMAIMSPIIYHHHIVSYHIFYHHHCLHFSPLKWRLKNCLCSSFAIVIQTITIHHLYYWDWSNMDFIFRRKGNMNCEI
jgi:hypothetical protein